MENTLSRQIGQYADDALYTEYIRFATSVCRRILSQAGTGQDAEECANDVLLEVLAHRDRYDSGRGSLRAYIAVLARSRALTLRKKLLQHSAVPFEDDILVQTDDRDAASGVLREAISKLSAEEQKLFACKYLYEYSVAEIAEAFGISAGNAKVRVSRLRKKLARLLRSSGLLVKEEKE